MWDEHDSKGLIEDLPLRTTRLSKIILTGLIKLEQNNIHFVGLVRKMSFTLYTLFSWSKSKRFDFRHMSVGVEMFWSREMFNDIYNSDGVHSLIYTRTARKHLLSKHRQCQADNALWAGSLIVAVSLTSVTLRDMIACVVNATATSSWAEF